MKSLLICKRACPIVEELEHEIACLKQENKSLYKRNEALRSQKEAAETRLSRVRQAAFGYLDPEGPDRG